MTWQEEIENFSMNVDSDRAFEALKSFILTHKREWKTYWHHLIDHLAEGGAIESYFDTL